jgi:hypothetical protein
VCIARANEWEESRPFGHRVQASPIEKTPCWEQLIEIFIVNGCMSAVDIRCGSNALFSSSSPFSLFSLVKYNGIFYFFLIFNLVLILLISVWFLFFISFLFICFFHLVPHHLVLFEFCFNFDFHSFNCYLCVFQKKFISNLIFIFFIAI